MLTPIQKEQIYFEFQKFNFFVYFIDAYSFHDILILKTRFYIKGEKCIYEKEFFKGIDGTDNS